MGPNFRDPASPAFPLVPGSDYFHSRAELFGSGPRPFLPVQPAPAQEPALLGLVLGDLGRCSSQSAGVSGKPRLRECSKSDE